MLRYLLRPPIVRPSRAVPGSNMRVSEDLRRCVVFLGIEEGTRATFIGTGFLLVYKHIRYLVTVKHVALALDDTPFIIRMNGVDEKEPHNIRVDPVTDRVKWYSHDDQDVDLAVLPFHFNLKQVGIDFLSVPEELVADAARIASEQIGTGDDCYTVGLFRLLAGRKRNLPVVHTGNIALLPKDERIPVKNWETANPKAAKTRHVEGYLVQSQSLQGLSGSPVFVRPSVDVDFTAIVDGVLAKLPRPHLYLLGVWQGAWDAPAYEVLAADRGRDLRVPVGMGVVVPAYKLVEVFESKDLREDREERLKRIEAAKAAKLD